MRVEICGGIGSGKTTLANLISERIFPSVFENFKANPFWQPFYSNPEKYNFETELTFLFQHYHDIKNSQDIHKNFACDFSFYQDLAYAVMGLKENRLKIFQATMIECLREVKQPDLLIYLECDEFTLFNRIQNRGRNEEATIQIDFLHFLNQHILNVVNEEKKDLQVITINSKIVNFANDNEDKNKVINIINQAMLS